MTRLSLLACAVLLACGSRSGLALEGTPSSGGSGGSVAVVACNALVPRDPVLTLAPDPAQQFDDALSLTESSDDGSRVSAVFVRQLMGQSALHVRYASFSPWKSWPASPTLGPVLDTPFELDSDVLPAPSSGGTFALAMGLAEGPVFVDHMNPVGPTKTPALQALTGIEPMFLGAGVDRSRHFAASYDGKSVIGQVIGSNVVDTPKLGCSSIQPVRAEAVPKSDGWLVAVSTGTAFGNCDDPSVTPGLPSRIDVLHVGFEGQTTNVGSIDDVGTVIDLGVAPHPSGMYVVWYAGSVAGSTTLRAARVVPGAVAAGPIELGFDDASGFALAALGDRLALAHRSASVRIAVHVYDESLTLHAQGSIVPELPFLGPSSALASPAGDALLVGWTNDGETPWHVRLARFDCTP